MKLRNKKTGKIVELQVHHIAGKSYESLADVSKDWEDYEEPKEYWYISDNYFETKEEAEKAAEKLKAWKRLKDKGFKFKTIHRNPQGSYNIYANFEGHIPPSPNDINIDLNICFGGEE